MTTFLYLCLFISIDGHKYSAAGHDPDAVKVEAEKICREHTMTKNPCVFEYCRRVQ